MISTAWVKDIIMQHENIGYLLMFTGPFLEGLTIPCPSMFIVLIGGALLVDSIQEYVLLVLLCSLAYTAASLIPYYLGISIQERIRFFVKGEYWSMFDRLFTLHGDKIVCFSRPLWIGNMVSYFAGIHKMKKGRFILYTFLGILPWHLTIMLVGRFFGSNIDAGIELVKEYSWLAVIILIGILMLSSVFKSFLENRMGGK